MRNPPAEQSRRAFDTASVIGPRRLAPPLVFVACWAATCWCARTTSDCRGGARSVVAGHVAEAAEQVCRSWGTATSTSTSGPTGGIAAEILVRCRADPALDAPLVRALMKATDPGTGRPLSDEAICAELGERPPRLCPGARWP